MTLLNAAYAVLSDPDKRKAHDLWTQRTESASSRRVEEPKRTPQRPTPRPAPRRAPPTPTPARTRARPVSYEQRYRVTYAVLALLMRSEEHTSELQSLMRISYAVFCLQKQNKPHNHNKNNN